MEFGLPIIGVISAIIGIFAGIAQVVDFLQKRNKKKHVRNDLKPSLEPSEVLDEIFPEKKFQADSGDISQPLGVFHNLPPRNEFVGRKEEIEKLHESLLSRLHLISIDGIGGIGKTSLALEVAHECLNKSSGHTTNLNERTNTFKGFVWVSTKGGDLVLDNILDEIAYTLRHIVVMKQPLKEKKKTILRILQDIPSLIIIDGFETITDSAIKDFIMDVPEPCKVLITTRFQNINNSKAISLKGLPEKDAINLIRTHGNAIGISEIEHSEDINLAGICKSTGGHPLAIKWILGQIKQKGQTLRSSLEYTANIEGNIFDQIFLNSWKLLSRDSQRILRIMPIFVTDANRQAIETASHVFGEELDRAIVQLTEMSLINSIEVNNGSAQRFGVHPLTRVFSLAQLEASDPKIIYFAKKDLAIFYDEYTQTHGGLWNLDGFELIKLDIANIISITKWCIQEELYELSANLLDNIRYFLVNYGYWNTALELAFDAIKLLPFENNKPYRRLKEWQTKIILLRIWPIAWIFRFRGSFDTAQYHITSALELLENDRDEYNLAYAKRHLSLVLQQTGDMEKAERLLLEAREFSFSIQNEEDRKYRTQLLTADLSTLALKRGDLNKAWELSSIVFDISRQILNDTENHNFQNLQTIAIFYRVLGSVARQRGDFTQAKELCQQALTYTEKLDYRDGIADACFELAQIELEIGQIHSARERFDRAYLIYKALGMDQKIKEIESALSKLSETEDGNYNK